jgi:hypothetical protein
MEAQPQPAKKQVSLRGLNRNHNHELKNILNGEDHQIPDRL